MSQELLTIQCNFVNYILHFVLEVNMYRARGIYGIVNEVILITAFILAAASR